MTTVKLPPSSVAGAAPASIDVSGPIIVLGANGAGKSRFTDRLLADTAPAFAMSAVDALYSVSPAPGPAATVDTLYRDAGITDSGRPMTGFERLLRLLLHHEMLNVLEYKFAGGESRSCRPLPPTRLDRLIDMWQQIFPGNRMLVEGGRLLFARGDDTRSYEAMRLSDGERAVIYYIASALFAPEGAVVAVSAPEMFLHPSVMVSLWNHIELLRPDCTWLYTTHDLEFATSRTNATTIWIRDFDPDASAWDFRLLPDNEAMPDEVLRVLTGSRKPVLFIEGDAVHSIDSKLYPLIFPDYSVKPLGGCNRVIEATRTFNDLSDFHKLDSQGIVDRDRRDEKEVAYLRRKRVMVPDVAEIENLFMLPQVIKAVAMDSGHDPAKVFDRVRHNVLSAFASELRSQALEHTRHRLKKLVEVNIDSRIPSITALERHINRLPELLNARRIYNDLCTVFHTYVDRGDYMNVLKVYNRKSMLSASGVATICGLVNRENYIARVIAMLHDDTETAAVIREAMRRCFNLPRPRQR